MIRITKLTDYGIVLMSHLATAPERSFNAPELAAETKLPQPMVSKILKRLTKAGLLVSQRGVHGGYGLARAAEAISVTEIITALEGPIAVTECSDTAAGICSSEPFCPVSRNWRRINRAISEALSGITLAEMRHPQAGQGTLVALGSRHAASAH